MDCKKLFKFNDKNINRLQMDLKAIMYKKNINEELINHVLELLPYEFQVIEMCKYIMNNVNISDNDILNYVNKLMLKKG